MLPKETHFRSKTHTEEKLRDSKKMVFHANERKRKPGQQYLQQIKSTSKQRDNEGRFIMIKE